MVAAPPAARRAKPPARLPYAGKAGPQRDRRADRDAGEAAAAGKPRHSSKKPKEAPVVDVGKPARLIPPSGSGSAAAADAAAVIEFGWADEASAGAGGGRRAKADRDRKKKLKPGSFGA